MTILSLSTRHVQDTTEGATPMQTPRVNAPKHAGAEEP